MLAVVLMALGAVMLVAGVSLTWGWTVGMIAAGAVSVAAGVDLALRAGDGP